MHSVILLRLLLEMFHLPSWGLCWTVPEWYHAAQQNAKGIQPDESDNHPNEKQIVNWTGVCLDVHQATWPTSNPVEPSSICDHLAETLSLIWRQQNTQEGLTHIQSQIKPRLLFVESFTLNNLNCCVNNRPELLKPIFLQLLVCK